MKCPFKVGDVVRLKEPSTAPYVLTPQQLVKKGHENRFHVTKVKEYPKHTVIYPQGVISLAECCNRKGFICTAHPAEYFEKVKE